MSGSEFFTAILRKGNLKNVGLNHADLAGADLSGASLNRGNLTDANLAGVKNANISGAYSSLQLNEVQNQEFTNQIILLLPASCLLPPASKPVTLYLMQKKTAVLCTPLPLCRMVVLFAVAKLVNADRNSDAIAATFNNFKKYLILSKKTDDYKSK